MSNSEQKLMNKFPNFVLNCVAKRIINTINKVPRKPIVDSLCPNFSPEPCNIQQTVQARTVEWSFGLPLCILTVGCQLLIAESHVSMTKTALVVNVFTNRQLSSQAIRLATQ